jgi:hypothetical protein
LRDLAGLLRDRKPIPDELADFLADAIEATAGKNLPDKTKGKAFTDELELTANNRRRAEIGWQDVEVERDFGDDASQNKFAARLAEIHQVTPSTILNRLQEADEERKKDIEELRRLGGV